MKEMAALLAERFQLTEEELAELLGSGQQTVFSNRIAWAKTHMKKAGLVEYPSRGQVRLTPQRLLDSLFLINELATPPGMDALLAAAERACIPPDVEARQSPADVAVQVWLLVQKSGSTSRWGETVGRCAGCAGGDAVRVVPAVRLEAFGAVEADFQPIGQRTINKVAAPLWLLAVLAVPRVLSEGLVVCSLIGMSGGRGIP